MPVQNPIGIDSLRDAFSLSEDMLKGERNRSITKSIVNDMLRSIQWEKSLDRLFISTLSDVFPEYDVRPKHSIDICLASGGQIVGAIECKGMVSNSHSSDSFRDSLDVWGVGKAKLDPDNPKKNSVRTDIENIREKMPDAFAAHWEIFVPIVYEVYRDGATTKELFEERKPWTTHPKYRRVRKTLKEDFIKWFERKYPSWFTLIHAADNVKLVDAKEIWTELCEGKVSCTPVSEAYVSFFAFGRYVEK